MAKRNRKTEQRRRYQRCWLRNKIHPNWRQIIHWYNGMCAVCGEEVIQDLHDPFGEDHNGNGKMQLRIPLCETCHYAEHQRDGGGHNSKNLCYRFPSAYLDDLAVEIVECGGYSEWMEKYGITDDPPQMFAQGKLKLDQNGE